MVAHVPKLGWDMFQVSNVVPPPLIGKKLPQSNLHEQIVKSKFFPNILVEQLKDKERMDGKISSRLSETGCT